MIKQICKREVNILKSVAEIEDRFLSQADKDFLEMIVGSMVKGRGVQVKKINAVKQETSKNDHKTLLSQQDKDNVMSIFEMFGGTYNK